MEKLSFLKNVTSRVYALSSDSAMKTMIKDYWLIEKVNTNSEIFFLKNVTSRVYARLSDSAMKTIINDYWLIEKKEQKQ